MIKRTTTYDSKVFKEFTRLDKENHHSVVHFYELHEDEVNGMNLEERFVMLVGYANALFEIDSFKRYCNVANEIIELSISQNIQFYNGEDVYLKTLFQKAKSHYSLLEYKDSEHIVKELTRMVPNHKPYHQLLFFSMLRQRPNGVKKLLNLGIVLYLIGVALIVVDVSLSYFIEKIQFISPLYIALLSISVVTLLGGVLAHRVFVYFKVLQIRNKAKAFRKRKKDSL